MSPRSPADYVLGIDVGGSKLLAHLQDATGRLLRSERRCTGRSTYPDRLLTMIQEVWHAMNGEAAVAAVGIGFPGLTNVGTGTVLSSTILDGWRGVTLARRVSQILAVPCAVDNDVNNAARAEAAVRAPEDRQDMLFVSVGTGIGGALVLLRHKGHEGSEGGGIVRAQQGHRGSVGARA